MGQEQKSKGISLCPNGDTNGNLSNGGKTVLTQKIKRLIKGCSNMNT